ncbi:hypothetical protein ACFX13_036159 [Malus domestica]
MHSLHLRPPSPTSQVLPSQTVATTISDFVFDSSGFPWITKDGVIWQPMPQQNCGDMETTFPTRYIEMVHSISRSGSGKSKAYSPFSKPLEVSVELVTVSLLSAAGPECTVKWELKLVVTNPNSKHGFNLYIGDRLQATLFLYDPWLGGSFIVTTKSLHPPMLLTNKTNQTATLSFKMQTDCAYLSEELIEEISRRIIQVYLNVMARFRLMPMTLKLEGFRVLRLSCPNMGLCEFDSTRSMEIV